MMRIVEKKKNGENHSSRFAKKIVVSNASQMADPFPPGPRCECQGKAYYGRKLPVNDAHGKDSGMIMNDPMGWVIAIRNRLVPLRWF